MIMISCVERNSADWAVDPEGRRGKHGEAQGSIRPPARDEDVRLPSMITRCAAITQWRDD